MLKKVNQHQNRMDKWSFNNSLFSKLSKVLQISEAEIARRCGLTQQVLNRYTKADITPSVQVLLKICNALRMPAHYFVSQDSNHIIPERESATLPYERWKVIEWNTQAVELTFGDGEGKIYWKDVAAVMGVTSQKPHERFLLRKRFPIDVFFAVCNHYDISPFRFLIDPNIPNDLKHKGRDTERNTASPSRSDDPLLADIAELRKKITTLTATVEDLSKKYSTLLKSHEALSRRVSVNIENINNSHLSIAAEPAPPYGAKNSSKK